MTCAAKNARTKTKNSDSARNHLLINGLSMDALATKTLWEPLSRYHPGWLVRTGHQGHGTLRSFRVWVQGLRGLLGEGLGF